MSNDVATFRGGSEIFCNEFAEMRLGQEHLERSLGNLRGVSVCWESAAGFRNYFLGLFALSAKYPRSNVSG
jgi:hypothetical protein